MCLHSRDRLNYATSFCQCKSFRRTARRPGTITRGHIATRPHRRNGRSTVLTEAEAAPVSAAQHIASNSGGGGGGNRTLIKAIAKGHRWQAQLESGEYASLEDVAKDVGCDRTYVGRMLRLTSLAPDIAEAILRGDEPDGLSLEKLRKNLPVRRDEQRGDASQGGPIKNSVWRSRSRR